jgi:hypothetical protein
MNRVQWAENLIKQLDMAHGDQHEGAKSWLLNYGGAKTVVTDLPEPEPSRTCSNEPVVGCTLAPPYRRAVQLTAYSPSDVTAGFYAAVDEGGAMWILPWGGFEWSQLPCLPGAIVL